MRLFHTWGNNLWNSKEVMRLTSRGRLGINTTTPSDTTSPTVTTTSASPSFKIEANQSKQGEFGLKI